MSTYWVVISFLMLAFGMINVVNRIELPTDPSQRQKNWSPFLEWLFPPSSSNDVPPPPPPPRKILMNPKAWRRPPKRNKTSALTKSMLNVPRPKRKQRIKKKIPKLGIILDTARHFFSPPWIMALMDYMAALGFNWLHLRLSDDDNLAFAPSQYFDVSQPTKNNDHHLYSLQDLQSLVAYGRKRQITLVPELSLPGRAASWKSLAVPCPRYTCTYGENIPLNIYHAHFDKILNHMLADIRRIFGSDYIHLGGSHDGGLEQAMECYKEAGILVDMEQFDRDLDEKMRGFSNIIRSDDSPHCQPNKKNDTHNNSSASLTLCHYFSSKAIMKNNSFVTTGLSMESSIQDDDAYQIYKTTAALVDRQPSPHGVVVGAMDLSSDWWVDRNVFGRMIAIAMGTTEKKYTTRTDFEAAYNATCASLLGTKSRVCQQNGNSSIPFDTWQTQQWQEVVAARKYNTCLKLTEPTEIRLMKWPNPLSSHFYTRQAEETYRARRIFLERLDRVKRIRPKRSYQSNKYGKPEANHKEAYAEGPPQNNEKNSLFHHVVGHTGVTVDLSRYFFPIERLKQLLDFLSVLGFNTLHLRLLDDHAFNVKLWTHPDMALSPKQGGSVYTIKGLEQLIFYAHSVGIEVIPEVNFISRAGGMFAGGFVAPCPNFICQQGYGIPVNLTNTPVMAVMSNIIEELRMYFNSPFIHLGYDEREESAACFREAKINVDHDDVERKLMSLLSVLEIPWRLAIRWESSDARLPDHQRERAGMVTHFQYTNPPLETKVTFFISTDLQFHNDNDDDAWEIYHKTRNYTQYKNVLGIFGGTLGMSPQMWNGRNVEGKLIAMAIGASNMDEMSYNEFQEAYTKTCNVLKLDGDVVNLFGKSRWNPTMWKEEYTKALGMRKNETCNRMTGLVPSRKPKTEVFGGTTQQ